MVASQGAIGTHHVGRPWQGGAFWADVKGVSVLVFGWAEGGHGVWGDNVRWCRELAALTVGVERGVGAAATTSTVSERRRTGGEVSEPLHGPRGERWKVLGGEGEWRDNVNFMAILNKTSVL